MISKSFCQASSKLKKQKNKVENLMDTSVARADFDDWGDNLNYAWYPKVFAKLLQN